MTGNEAGAGSQTDAEVHPGIGAVRSQHGQADDSDKAAPRLSDSSRNLSSSAVMKSSVDAQHDQTAPASMIAA